MAERLKQLAGRAAADILVVFAGISFYLVLAHFGTVSRYIGAFFDILTPFIWGLVIAYLLDGPVRFLEAKLFGGRRLPGILLAYLLAVLIVGLLAWIVVPQLGQSLVTLSITVPNYLTQLNALLDNLQATYGVSLDGLEGLVGTTQTMAANAIELVNKFAPQLLDYSKAIGNGVITAFTALVSSFYMLLGKYVLLAQARKCIHALLPKKAASILLQACYEANEAFGGFIVGKLIDSAIIGVICYIGCRIMDMPYVLLISVVIGVTNIIPVFGPFIGAVPCILILLMINPIKALIFVVFVLVLQQVDGNIIGPKILGDSTGLSAMWVLVAIIIGQGLFGIVGMIIGVPLFSLIYNWSRRGIHLLLARRGLDENGNPLQETAAG